MYLVMDMPFIYKKSFSKFRCSNHKLRIEVGRHINIDREKIIFIYCLNDNNISFLDCEFHAFFNCIRYYDIHQCYLFNWYDRGLELNDFYSLMSSSCERNICNVCTYVHQIISKQNVDRGM